MNLSHDAVVDSLPYPLDAIPHEPGERLHFGDLGGREHDDSVVREVSAIVKRSWVTEISWRAQFRRKAQPLAIAEQPHRHWRPVLVVILVGFFCVDSQP